MSNRSSAASFGADAPRRLLALGFSLTLVFLAAGCARVETAAGPPPLPQVTAAAAIARDVTEWDEFTGRLEPVQSVGVRPRVSGLLSNVTFEEGSLVRQGQLLFQLDDRPFVAQVERLKAELAQATAARSRAASEMHRADHGPCQQSRSDGRHTRHGRRRKRSVAHDGRVDRSDLRLVRRR